MYIHVKNRNIYILATTEGDEDDENETEPEHSAVR